MIDQIGKQPGLHNQNISNIVGHGEMEDDDEEDEDVHNAIPSHLMGADGGM